jgi:putative ABC transport system permease protein
VAVFALLLAAVTGLLCGLAPAFAALRTNVNSTLKEGGRSGSAGGGHARLRSTLVVAEIAIALVLLTASGLLLRSFEKMRAVDLGFRPQHVTTAAYSLSAKAIRHPGRRRCVQQRVVASAARASRRRERGSHHVFARFEQQQ